VNPLALCKGHHKFIYLERANLALLNDDGTYTVSPTTSNARVYATFDMYYCERCLTYVKVQIGTPYAAEWYLECAPVIGMRALCASEDTRG